MVVCRDCEEDKLEEPVGKDGRLRFFSWPEGELVEGEGAGLGEEEIVIGEGMS